MIKILGLQSWTFLSLVPFLVLKANRICTNTLWFEWILKKCLKQLCFSVLLPCPFSCMHFLFVSAFSLVLKEKHKYRIRYCYSKWVQDSFLEILLLWKIGPRGREYFPLKHKQWTVVKRVKWWQKKARWVLPL